MSEPLRPSRILSNDDTVDELVRIFGEIPPWWLLYDGPVFRRRLDENPGDV